MIGLIQKIAGWVGGGKKASSVVLPPPATTPVDGATRLGDLCMGHPTCPPRMSITASPNVFVNNIASHRQLDLWAPHCSPPHINAYLVTGSSTVYVNNKQMGRVGDPISCLTTVATGSLNVFVGG